MKEIIKKTFQRHIKQNNGVISAPDKLADALVQALKTEAAAAKACREINAENPIAAAAAILEMWRLIKDGLPIIEAEAIRRQDAFFGQIEPYWSEMRELADRIEALILKAWAKEGA